jgi:hypothetical protein
VLRAKMIQMNRYVEASAYELLFYTQISEHAIHFYTDGVANHSPSYIVITILPQCVNLSGEYTFFLEDV